MQKIGLILILGILFFSIETYSQSSNDAAPKSLSLEKIIKHDGWEIPDLSNEKSFDFTQSNGIFVKGYSFIQKVPLQKLDFYALNEKDKSLKVLSRDCKLRSGESYSIKGKVYAYYFICVPLLYGDVVNEKGEIVDRTIQYSGAILSFSFFDADGDGIFETKYLNAKVPDTIPDWAKKQ